MHAGRSVRQHGASERRTLSIAYAVGVDDGLIRPPQPPAQLSSIFLPSVLMLPGVMSMSTQQATRKGTTERLPSAGGSVRLQNVTSVWPGSSPLIHRPQATEQEVLEAEFDPKNI
jgi:hypothetical protein